MSLISNCRDVHRLVSEGMDRRLTVYERVRLRAHLLFCRGCTNFSGQMRLLRQATRSMSAPGMHFTDEEQGPK